MTFRKYIPQPLYGQDRWGVAENRSQVVGRCRLEMLRWDTGSGKPKETREPCVLLQGHRPPLQLGGGPT